MVSPIGVPAPTRTRRSLSSLLSIGVLPWADCRERQASDADRKVIGVENRIGKDQSRDYNYSRVVSHPKSDATTMHGLLRERDDPGLEMTPHRTQPRTSDLRRGQPFRN